jgi:hypothetical protein
MRDELAGVKAEVAKLRKDMDTVLKVLQQQKQQVRSAALSPKRGEVLRRRADRRALAGPRRRRGPQDSLRTGAGRRGQSQCVCSLRRCR